jgi:hypothetical protein
MRARVSRYFSALRGFWPVSGAHGPPEEPPSPRQGEPPRVRRLADDETADGADESPRAAPVPLPPPPVVVPRWIQLVLLPLALLGLWALARAAGPVLLILIAAGTAALILNPLVKILERRHLPRGLAIPVVYLGLLAVVVGIGVLLSDPVSTQVNHFAKNVPKFVKRANHDLANIQAWLNHHGLRVQIQQQGHTALQTLEKNVIKGSGNFVSFSRGLLSKVVTVGFDLVLALVPAIWSDGSCRPATAPRRTITR